MGTTPSCQCKCKNDPKDSEVNLPNKLIITPTIEENLNHAEAKIPFEPPKITKEIVQSTEIRFQRAYPTIITKTKGKDVCHDNELNLNTGNNSMNHTPIKNNPNDNNGEIERLSNEGFEFNPEQIEQIAPISSKNSIKELMNTSTERFNKNIIQEIDKTQVKSLKQNLGIATKTSSLQQSNGNKNHQQEETVMSLKEFAAMKGSGIDIHNDYIVDKKLTLRKINDVKEISISSIIPSITLKNEFNDDALFHSELKKFQYGDMTTKNKIKYTPKFCVITKGEFRCYGTKEKFIMLQRPQMTILLKDIKTVTLVSIEGIFKNNMFNFMINRKKKDDYEVYASLNEEIVNKWVVVLNYLLNELANN